MKEVVKQTGNTVSDLATAGVIGGILNLANNTPPGIQTLITLGLPALACVYNLGNRIINEKIAKKDYEKLYEFISSLEHEMQRKGLVDLQRFIGMDFSTDEYATLEELITTGINAKNKWIRKFASSILVTIGSIDLNDLRGLHGCVRVLRELDDLDARLLLLHIARQYRNEEDYNELLDDIMSDDLVYAQSIDISSDRLASLGMVRRGCSLFPYDNPDFKNKKEMISDFIMQNQPDGFTVLCSNFIKFINALDSQ